jgi:hypothetical protein
MLAWWVDRLNVLYSHATDPTRFTDEHGFYDAAAQAAWTITIERLIGDALSLLAEPQATELDRVQLAFDLLDKAESLLGYGNRESGRGSRRCCAQGGPCGGHVRRSGLSPTISDVERAMRWGDSSRGYAAKCVRTPSSIG